MSVSPADAVATLSARWANEAALGERAAREALDLLPALLARLEGAGAREVFLFGSLAEGRFRRSSDIDLAVRGLSQRELAHQSSELSRIANRQVDLIPLEDAPESLIVRIAGLGRRLR